MVTESLSHINPLIYLYFSYQIIIIWYLRFYYILLELMPSGQSSATYMDPLTSYENQAWYHNHVVVGIYRVLRTILLLVRNFLL